MKRFVPALLLAGMLAGLVGLNVRWITTPIDLAPLAARAAVDNAPAEASVAESQSGLPALDVEEALRRPLFHADRRPFSPSAPEPKPEPVAEIPQPPPAAEPAPPVLAPELRLAGVSLSGQRKRALLGPASSTDVRWYAEGQTIEGWTLTDISGQTVQFTNGGRSVSFKLYPGALP